MTQKGAEKICADRQQQQGRHERKSTTIGWRKQLRITSAVKWNEWECNESESHTNQFQGLNWREKIIKAEIKKKKELKKKNRIENEKYGNKKRTTTATMRKKMKDN